MADTPRSSLSRSRLALLGIAVLALAAIGYLCYDYHDKAFVAVALLLAIGIVLWRLNVALREREAFALSALDALSANVAVLDRAGVITAVNHAWTQFAAENGGVLSQTGVGANYLRVIEDAVGASTAGAAEALVGIRSVLGGESSEFVIEYPCHSPDQQRWFMLRATPLKSEDGGAVVAHINITDRKQLELRRELSVQVLAVLNRGSDSTRMVKDILDLIQTGTGIDAAGIRLKEGNDFPYCEVSGFSPEFVASQACLCARQPDGTLVQDEDGCLVLKCVCGKVMSARENPSQPYFTPFGSFWTGSTTELLASASGGFPLVEDCHREGYESVALIPVCSDGRIIGLIHLADRRKNIFTPEALQFFEGLGASVGIALTRQLDEQFMHAATDDARRMLDEAEKSRRALLNMMEDRVQALEALQESEKRFRSLVDGAPGAIYVQSDERVLFANPAMLELVGVPTPEDLLGTDIMERIAPEYHEIARRRIRMQVETGLPAPLTDMEYVRSDGSRAQVATTSTPIRFTGKNAHLVFLHDISSRKQAERALIENTALLSNVMNSVREMICVKNADLCTILCNENYARALGKHPEEMLGKTDIENGWPPERVLGNPAKGIRGTDADDRDALAGKTTHTPYDPITIGNEHRIFETMKLPFRNANGDLVGVLGVSRDITKRQELEEQLRQSQKMEAVGLLAGGVAHDFNNILTGILGYAEMLKPTFAADSQQGKDLCEIIALSERAATLARQLLAFGRRNHAQMSVLNVNVVIGNAVKMLQRIIGEDVMLELQLASDLGDVRADVGQLEQVVMNLAVNARDAMPAGGTLAIATSNVDLDEEYARAHISVKPGSYIMLAVTDTGRGMDRETQQHIFEPFFTTKPVGKGSGLGLATVYGIIKQHKGNIWVYSEPARGTTFRIYLPRVEGTAGATHGVAAASAPPRGTETILLAEDEDSLRALACRTLRASGYTVHEAMNADKAHEIMEELGDSISLLLTDVVMPGRSGPELYTAEKGSHPLLKVLYMSGYAEKAAFRDSPSARGMPLLQKPFAPDALLRKVREVLDKG